MKERIQSAPIVLPLRIATVAFSCKQGRMWGVDTFSIPKFSTKITFFLEKTNNPLHFLSVKEKCRVCYSVAIYTEFMVFP